MKRQRGRGRKPGGGGGGGNHNHGNRSLESNGPDVKIRGTAAQIYEKYAQYARDAQSGGDRVKYENYLQHAEHYYRVMAATMPRERLLQQQEGAMQGHGQANGEGNAGPGEAHVNNDQPDTIRATEDAGADADEGDDDADAPETVEAASAEADDEDGEASGNDGQQGQQEGGGGRNRRRRGRRRHHDGDRPNAGGGGDTEARSALDSLARKQGALTGG